MIVLSIYYGTKLSTYVDDNTFKIAEIEGELKYNYQMYWHKENIPRLIEWLKKKKSHFLYITYRVTDKEIYIAEAQDAEVLDTGHKVKLFDKEGMVTGRTYDVTNDIMYYFTDIVMETVESEEVNAEFEEKRLKLIDDLEELYEQYFTETKEKKKGFFKRLFG